MTHPLGQGPEAPGAVTAHGAPPRAGAPLPWTVGDAVSWAFKALFSSGGRPAWHMAVPMLVLLVALVPLYGVIFASVFQQAQQSQEAGAAVPAPPAMWWGMGFTYPVLLFLSVWFWVGWTRYSLHLGRGGAPSIGLLFKSDGLLPAVGMFLVAIIPYYVGFLLLVVPGILLVLGWLFSLQFIVDRAAGPIEALKGSWRMTSGHRWPLFGLLLLMVLISMGLQMVCVGFFWSNPLMSLAFSYVYLRLNGEPGTLAGQPAAPTQFSRP